jgi:hypothetical protein
MNEEERKEGSISDSDKGDSICESDESSDSEFNWNTSISILDTHGLTDDPFKHNMELFLKIYGF